MGSEIQTKFAGQNRVIELAQTYLQVPNPDDRVLRALALSYLPRKQYPAFRDAASRALAVGAELRFSLLHHHSNLLQSSAHDAALILTSTAIRYEPEGRCNSKPFTLSLRQAKLANRSFPDGGAILTLRFPNPEKPDKDIVMNFIDADPARVASIQALVRAIDR